MFLSKNFIFKIKNYLFILKFIINSKLFKNLQNSAGLPVCVQIATLPNKEELCLSIMRTLEQEIKFN